MKSFFILCIPTQINEIRESLNRENRDHIFKNNLCRNGTGSLLVYTTNEGCSAGFPIGRETKWSSTRVVPEILRARVMQLCPAVADALRVLLRMLHRVSTLRSFSDSESHFWFPIHSDPSLQDCFKLISQALYVTTGLTPMPSHLALASAVQSGVACKLCLDCQQNDLTRDWSFW